MSRTTLKEVRFVHPTRVPGATAQQQEVFRTADHILVTEDEHDVILTALRNGQPNRDVGEVVVSKQLAAYRVQLVPATPPPLPKAK